jgi:hypothetical protein
MVEYQTAKAAAHVEHGISIIKFKKKLSVDWESQAHEHQMLQFPNQTCQNDLSRPKRSKIV